VGLSVARVGNLERYALQTPPRAGPQVAFL
jgi:hypothetical protein